MSGKTRTSLLSLAVIAVLIFSAIGPTIVYADGDQPPDTTTSDTIDGDHESDDGDGSKCDSDNGAAKNKKGNKNKSGNKHSGKCNPGDEPEDSGGSEGDPAAEVPAASGSDSTEVADAQQPAEAAAPVLEESAPPADPNLLAAVPENTSVTVVNAEGQPEPLATQEAATAIATTTDPIWCPQGQPPVPGANGCTDSFTSFNLLLTFLAGNAAYQGAGTIFVEQGTYGGGESVIDFNAYNLSNISSSDLTVQGGWDSTANPVDPATAGTSNFSVPILIGSSTNPWGGSLTINNIVITGAQSGLTLNTQNSITLSYVQVTDSVSGAGAELDAAGEVNINNSKFLRNNTAGATIRAGGNVAIGTSEFGNTFNQRRQIKGLDITSSGEVSLLSVLAIGNRRIGTTIDALGVVTIGSSVFSETNGLNGGTFYGYGLRVVTPDAIDLANVTANNNFLWGADLDAGGDVAIADSIFNGNSTESPTFIDDTGLLVTSGGRVSLSNVQASNNRLIGATIDAAGDITVNGSTFNNNRGITLDAAGAQIFHGYGLQAVTLGNIFISGVNASDNSLFGAHLDAGGDVFVDTSFFNNQTSGTATATGRGLEVISGGTAILDTVVMDNNQLFGGAIQAAGDIFLDTVTATNNGGDGVQVTTSCTQLVGGTYSGNGQYGLNLNNSALNVITPATFANNGAGDIFPATPTTCPPALTINPPAIPSTSGNPASTNSQQGSSSNGNTSNQQAVSYTGRGASGTSLVGLSLNGTFGITREVTGSSVVTSIFAGQYIYVYTIFTDDSSIDNLQIIIVSPAPVTGIARVGP